MNTLDLSTCPHCGQKNFPLVSLERVEAYTNIMLEGDPLTGFEARWGGSYDTNWDSSVPVCYMCLACGPELPEAYAAALDILLDNTREAKEQET